MDNSGFREITEFASRSVGTEHLLLLLDLVELRGMSGGNRKRCLHSLAGSVSLDP